MEPSGCKCLQRAPIMRQILYPETDRTPEKNIHKAAHMQQDHMHISIIITVTWLIMSVSSSPVITYRLGWCYYSTINLPCQGVNQNKKSTGFFRNRFSWLIRLIMIQGTIAPCWVQ